MSDAQTESLLEDHGREENEGSEREPAGDAEITATSDPASDTAPVVAVENLSKTYGDDVCALDSVSFEIRPGEVVGLLGPNGAGKTTCLKCTLGLVEPSGGNVEIAGVDARANPKAAHEHVGAMLEGARNVYWRLTTRENLEFFTGIAGRRPSKVRDRHDELLERFNLAEKDDEAVRDLSRGMKQKVSLATTLARDVNVAFLDEPTLGLDVESSLELRSELDTLAREEDLAVVLSSHDMDVIQDLCDRVIILSEGEIIANDSVEELLDVFRTQSYELQFESSDGSQLESELREAYDVTEWDEQDGRTFLTVTIESGNDLPELTGQIVDSGVELYAVNAVEPDLEDVFIQITGGESA
jgi:ABC-2 type transport system ATP-binding protein